MEFDREKWMTLRESLVRLVDNEVRVVSDDWLARCERILSESYRSDVSENLSLHLHHSFLQGELLLLTARRLGEISGVEIPVKGWKPNINACDVSQWATVSSTKGAGSRI
jgi:hypothetical protein